MKERAIYSLLISSTSPATQVLRAYRKRGRRLIQAVREVINTIEKNKERIVLHYSYLYISDKSFFALRDDTESIQSSKKSMSA